MTIEKPLTVETLAAACDAVRATPATYKDLPEATARFVAIVLADEALLKSRFEEDLEVLLRAMDTPGRKLCMDVQNLRVRREMEKYRASRKR